MHSTLYNGGVFPVAYPWMTEDLVTREDTCFEQVQKEFKLESNNCVVARSTIRSVLGDEESVNLWNGEMRSWSLILYLCGKSLYLYTNVAVL